MDVREKLVGLANDVLLYLPWGEIQKDTAERIADRIMDHGVTVQEWIPVSEPPKETGHYLVNIHQEDDEKGESADFVLDAWYQVNGLLFVPDTIGWTLLNEWHGLTEQMIPFITHWTKRPEPPKGE